MTEQPTFSDFLAMSVDDIAKVAPATLILGVGGTRRSAVLAGLSTQSEAYVHFAREQMIGCLALLFRYGVRHIFTAVTTQANFNEIGPYKERLLERVSWGVAGPEAMADYAHHGWRVRLVGGEEWPELHAARQRLLTQTPSQAASTLWFTVTSSSEAPWEQLLTAVNRSHAHTQAEAIRALYGQAIPPATMYLGFGKPEVYAALVPPVLIGKMQCYIRQQPGYSLTEREWRQILYDYAYLRATWRKDKTGREDKVLAHRHKWETAVTLGLGQRLGPFWFPQDNEPS